MRLVPLLLLCACWRGSEHESVEPEPVRQRGATCEEVADNARVVIAGSHDPALVKRADPLREIVERRCAEDNWSIELRRCVAGAKTVDDTDVCRKLATEPQQQAFAHELEVFEVSE